MEIVEQQPTPLQGKVTLAGNVKEMKSLANESQKREGERKGKGKGESTDGLQSERYKCVAKSG